MVGSAHPNSGVDRLGVRLVNVSGDGTGEEQGQRVPVLGRLELTRGEHAKSSSRWICVCVRSKVMGVQAF